MVGGEDIAAALLHSGNDSLHFRFDKVDIVPYLCVDTAVEGEAVAVELFQFKGIHSRFDLEGIEHFNARFENVGKERLDKSAGMHLGHHSALVRPIDRALVVRLDDLAVCGGGEEGRALVAHIVVPENAVKFVACVKNALTEVKLGVKIGFNDILDPIGVFVH